MMRREDFNAALAEHGRVLHRFAVTLSSRDEAEDLVQDALARAWKKHAQFDPQRGSLRSWPIRPAPGGGKQPLFAVLEADVITAAADELSVEVGRQVAALPPRQRAAVVLHDFVDVTVDDVAALMSCSLGIVKSSLHDACKALADALGATYAQD